MPHTRALTGTDEQPSTIALSPLQAANASSLSLRTITVAIANGTLRSVKKGRRRLILVDDLKNYLLRETTEGAR